MATQTKDSPAVGILLGGAGLLLIVGGIFLVMIAAAFSTFGGSGGGGEKTAASDYKCGSDIGSADEVTKKVKQSKKEPPEILIPVYQAAAAKYGLGDQGPSILAAINRIETAFGTNRNVSTAGAQGWMQFMPATWKTQGVDADKDGKKEIQDPDDAIFGAANYLKNSGGQKNWRNAIFAYNHADWYVNDILSNARKYDIPAISSCK